MHDIAQRSIITIIIVIIVTIIQNKVSKTTITTDKQ